MSREGIELTDTQIAAQERKASDDEACGESKLYTCLVLITAMLPASDCLRSSART